MLPKLSKSTENHLQKKHQNCYQNHIQNQFTELHLLCTYFKITTCCITWWGSGGWVGTQLGSIWALWVSIRLPFMSIYFFKGNFQVCIFVVFIPQQLLWKLVNCYMGPMAKEGYPWGPHEYAYILVKELFRSVFLYTNLYSPNGNL